MDGRWMAGIAGMATGAVAAIRRGLVAVVVAGIVALLGIPAAAGIGPPPRVAAASDDPAAVVVAYYRAIAGYDYQAAYDLLGAAFQQQQTLARFTAGFADTAYVEADVLGQPRSTAAGAVVDVRITAWHNDRTIHRFSGSYTVGVEGGADKIVDATIREDPPPTGVPPLCRPADLSASATGDAGAGNRFATFTLTNTSGATCVLGGYPHVVLRGDGGQPLLGSTHGPAQTIATVTLRPGRAATVDLRWVNWCGQQLTGNPTALVTLPGDSVNRVTVPNAIAVPPCLGEGEPSLLTVQPFTAPQ